MEKTAISDFLNSLKFPIMPKKVFFVSLLWLICYNFCYAQIISTHPRVLLNNSIKNQLLVKKNSNEASWLALKVRADALAAYPVLSWNENTYYLDLSDQICYSYQGGGWYDAAFALGMAHQMTKGNATGNQPDIYSDKLLQLADSILAAQNNFFMSGSDTIRPVRVDSYYPSRFVCRAVAVIFDWCYDELGSTRRTQLVNLINHYYDAIRQNGYETNNRAGNNYFSGHFVGIGFMGYASYGSNSRAEELINWADNRFDGTVYRNLGSDTTKSHFTQTFLGGYKNILSTETYNNPTDITGAPCKGGFYVEGWAYGAALGRVLDYMQMRQTAANENLFSTYQTWLIELLKAQKHSLHPNRSEIDFFSDYGGSYGAFAPLYLTTRLAYLLAGTTEGAGAQHLRYNFVQPPVNECLYTTGFLFPDEAWERFYFEDLTRPSAPMNEPLYYSGFPNSYLEANHNDLPLPYFIMRNSWDTAATWASAKMGASVYEGHEHNQTGHIALKRNSDFMLIEASIFKSSPGENCGGLVGNNVYATNSAFCNTLFFHDYGDYMYSGSSYVGGQSVWGKDEVVAAEQTDDFSYIRSDLSSAYYSNYDSTQWNNRKLRYFYRSLLYLPKANVFLVFDQVKAANSTNPAGQYIKELRWHTPATPTLNDNRVTAIYRNSKLRLHTLLPQNAAITLVDESNNPDNTAYYDGQDANSPTWRVAVRHNDNTVLEHPFLTVFTAGNLTLPDMNTTNMTTNDNKMTGASIVLADNSHYIALFNQQSGQTPTPISNTTYNYTGNGQTTHTLCGMLPNTNYNVTDNGSSISIAASPTGSYTSTVSGILQFCIIHPVISGNFNTCLNVTQTYSVTPIAGSTYAWTVTGGTIVSGQSTNQIVVQWTNGTVGTVNVVQTAP